MFNPGLKFFCFGLILWFLIVLLVISQWNRLSKNERKLKPIAVDNFFEHYQIMSAYSNAGFLKEYDELYFDKNLEVRCTAAVLPCNLAKNRYCNVLPYDHSRFKLQSINNKECSDYINADYVPGYNSSKEFIATQGPLNNTRNDFWRMVWESDSKAIVMLTRTYENGQEKCDSYWPKTKNPTKYGEISVTVVNETSYADWTISELLIQKDNFTRKIQHFHFLSWPDFSVPSSPRVLIKFVRTFREKIKDYPVIVHCSAGIGRTGTFITLDRLIHQINKGDEYIDVFGTIQDLRSQRFWMVQHHEQYIFIHQCLLSVLRGE